jgi:hypothetical protein
MSYDQSTDNDLINNINSNNTDINSLINSNNQLQKNSNNTMDMNESSVEVNIFFIKKLFNLIKNFILILRQSLKVSFYKFVYF